MNENLISNRYKPLFNRARGGFSDVIVAWDTRLTRRVAIKRINTGKSLPVASLEEARTAALLSSNNIVSVYDFEYNDTETLIIMENIDGPSLAELMSSSTQLLDIDVITTVLDGVVSALEYAHENQVLHLDIKPANILIDQSGHVKVSDFGLAELAGVQGFSEVQGGTIGYMPPEQLTGGLVDMRTDIWAFASLSYQLLTGQNPFFALSPRESLQNISAGRFALPSELRPSLGGAADEALIKALSPQMDSRPGSIAELWADLRPFLGKIGPGRRTLKALAREWAGKEAALMEGSEISAADISDEYADGAVEEAEAAIIEPEQEKEDKIAIWNGNYEDDEEPWSDERAEERRQRRAQKRADRKQARAEREPKDPLWQRLGPSAQKFLAHAFCAFGAASMAWLAMSALPYLSDPLAQAATVAANNTGNPTPALLDAAFTARLIIMILAGVVAFIVPRIGSVLATLCLCLGFFFTGNWLIGILVLVCCAVWWFFIGRQSPADSAVFSLSPILTVFSLPMLVPLLSGYFQNWKRALGTTALACFVCSLLSTSTYGLIDTLFSSILGLSEAPVYGLFHAVPLEELLSASPTMMQMSGANDLFIPLITLFTSAEFWLILICWLGASVVMSLLNSGKSRVKYILATLCGFGIITVGYLLPYFLFVGTDNIALLAAIVIRLIIALAVCLLLIALGVPPRPANSEGKGRTK